ncbi:hypothetical protein GCM10009562_22080 [Nocardioides aquaticus]
MRNPGHLPTPRTMDRIAAVIICVALCTPAAIGGAWVITRLERGDDQVGCAVTLAPDGTLTGYGCPGQPTTPAPLPVGTVLA